MASGFPIKMGSVLVETVMTDVNDPFPGKSPLSVGTAISAFVETNVAPSRTAKQAMANFS